MNTWTKLVNFIKKDIVLGISFLLAVGSMFLVPPSNAYLHYIDQRVMILLFSLMAVMAGFQKIGLFHSVADFFLRKMKSTREMAMVLVGLCFFWGMLITNDVALITFVPFTLMVLPMVHKEKMVISVVVLQTIAANLGSMLTPIGNPQNLYLYSFTKMGLLEFIKTMLPYSLLSLFLLLFVLLLFKNEPLLNYDPLTKEEVSETHSRKVTRQRRMYEVMFLLCLLTVAHVISPYLLMIIILITLLIMDKEIIGKVDYGLLLTFVCFFIFIGNMGNMEHIRQLMEQIIDKKELLTGIMLSQVISNVPAAILLSEFAQDYKGLLIGVNLGGLGTLIASLASLISYKFFMNQYPHKKGKYLLVFTGYNLGFLAVLFVLSCILH